MGNSRRIAAALALALVCAVTLRARADDAASAAANADAELVAKLREASALRDKGDYGGAAKKLAKLEDSEVGPALGLARTRLLRADGEPEKAAHVAEATAARIPAAELRAHLYAELAAIYLERNDLASAHQAQQAAWDATRDSDYAARLTSELAQAYEARDHAPEALELYTRVWKSFPLSGAAVTAFAKAQALAAKSGAPAPESAPLLARADRLREGFRCDLALPLYESVLARPETTAEAKPGLERRRADCLFMLRRYTDAASDYAALSAADPKDLELRFQQARAQSRAGQRDAAIAELEKLSGPKSAPALRAKAQSLLAVIVEDDDPKRAQRELRKVEKQTADPALALQARWSLAWADLRGDTPGAALPRLDQLAAAGPSSDVEVQRARYWRGVARAGSADPAHKAEGEAQLAELAREVPLSYYGMLAGQRVGAPPIEHSFVGARPPEAVPPALHRTQLLLDGGFPELAADEVESYADEGKVGREARLTTARLLHQVGDPYRALRLIDDSFGPTLEQGIDPAWRDAWELAWPRPFGDWVGSSTKEFGFDPALVWAIMREESAYRPRVASPAGALGLMQLIPPTAGRVAGELGIPDFAADRLYDPETNIRLGTYYLRSLVERWDGSQPLAIASYNAGPEAVQRWLRKYGGSEPDVFVETVSYGETRRYLRRVLRSYRIYQLLYGDAVKPEPKPAMPAAAQTEAEPGR